MMDYITSDERILKPKKYRYLTDVTYSIILIGMFYLMLIQITNNIGVI